MPNIITTAPAPQPDAITDFLNGNIAGFPTIYILLIVIVGVIIVFLIKRKKGDEFKKPQEINPDKETFKEFEAIIKSTGSTLPYKRDCMLNAGFMNKGRVVGWSFFRWEKDLDLKAIAKKNKSSERIAQAIRNEYKADNFYLLQVIPKDIISYILFKILKYNSCFHLIDMQYIIKSKDFDCTIFAQQKRFYEKVWIYSEFGQRVIQGMVNHMTLKQVLKDQVNHIPQMHYFDYKTGRFAAKARELRDIRKAGWKDQEEKLERDDE